MFYIWYTSLEKFLHEIPMDALVYHAVLHTTAGTSQSLVKKAAALHLRAIEREINTIHLLAIPIGHYATINGKPFDGEHYATITRRTQALEAYVLPIVEEGFPIYEAIPTVPKDIEYIYAEWPEGLQLPVTATGSDEGE